MTISTASQEQNNDRRMYSTQCRVRRGLKTIGKDRGITKAAGRRKSQGAQCEREYHPISSIEARGCVIKINIIISKMVYTTSKTKMTIYYLKLGLKWAYGRSRIGLYLDQFAHRNLPSFM